MATNILNHLVRNVRRAAMLREPAALPDGRLLESFLACRDEAAFAVLVKRHGPMVLGVCMRVIGNVHDAEDAFQAVFMVLARRAASIVPRDLVGNWLYGVAYRTALQARSRLGRRHARERQVTEVPEPMVAPEADVQEMHRLLDMALEQLPEKFRVPIVLCDLEGRARKDVASQLKIPEGTLSSRLSKARELLARRLARHGVALSGVALASVLTGQAMALEPGILGATVKAAALVAAGQSAAGVVSAEVIALSEGALKTMFLQKLKVVSMLFIGITLGALGLGAAGFPGDVLPAAQAAEPFHAIQIDAPRPATGNDREPLDGSLLLDTNVQAELRLSKGQIGKLQGVSHDVDTKTVHNQKQIKELQKQIDELQKRMEELNRGISAEHAQVNKQRSQALAKAAPEILSDKAVKRLRQIQWQQRNLNELLADPKIQRVLKIDDEQLKRIETILKTENMTSLAFVDYLGSQAIWWDTTTGRKMQPFGIYANQTNVLLATDYSNSWNSQALQKLFNVLTPVQQRTVLDWVGEPYHNSWRALQKK